MESMPLHEAQRLEEHGAAFFPNKESVMRIPILASLIACCVVAHPSVSHADAKAPKAEKLRHSVGEPRPNQTLPANVVAPKGKLTLFADYMDGRGDAVVLYLVNRTSKDQQFDAQDGSIFIKLEYQDDGGRWKRAQPHWYSWCGNSYGLTPVLKPGQHFKFLGYSPTKGKQARVRFRQYADDMTLVSNIGRGFVRPQDIREASTDRMAIYHGDLVFVTAVAEGRILPAKEDAWLSAREAAVYTLGDERFAPSRAIPILKRLQKDPDKEVQEVATSALKTVEARQKKMKEQELKAQLKKMASKPDQPATKQVGERSPDQPRVAADGQAG